MKNTQIYKFMYNPCIHESAFMTISLHRTEQGAINAMNKHKQEQLDEFNESYGEDNPWDFKFGEHEAWNISIVEIED